MTGKNSSNFQAMPEFGGSKAYRAAGPVTTLNSIIENGKMTNGGSNF